MILHIYQNGLRNSGLFLLPIANLFSVDVIFNTAEARNSFVASLPKYVKPIITTNGGGWGEQLPGACVVIDQVSKATGTANEAGAKRLKRFIDAINIEIGKQIKPAVSR